MAPPPPTEGDVSLSLWSPFFEGDDLPGSFPKYILGNRVGGPARPVRHGSPGPASDVPAATPTSSGRKTQANPSERLRLPGGVAPAAKRVTANLDSDDELLKSMMETGEKHEDIVAAIVARGGQRYKPKTIVTRYSRIKNVLSAHEDDLLDDELTDWHEGEDDHLLQAYEEASNALAAEWKTLEARRWAIVKDNLHFKIRKTKYSSRACWARLTALRKGKAEVPFERAPDLVARRAKVLARKAARQAAKMATVVAERVAKLMKEAADRAKRHEEHEQRLAREVKQTRATAKKAFREAAIEGAKYQKDVTARVKANKMTEYRQYMKKQADERVIKEKMKALRQHQRQKQKDDVKRAAAAEKVADQVEAAKAAHEKKVAELARIQDVIRNKAILYEHMGIDPIVSQTVDDDFLNEISTPVITPGPPTSNLRVRAIEKRMKKRNAAQLERK